nr:hypothetical protein [Haloferax sp. BAB-2207]
MDKSIVRLVRVYADDIRENLPRPGRSWEWVECDLDPSLQQRLASHDLIVRDGETGRWETTERFWSYVLYRLGTSEDGLGTELGQEQLFAPNVAPDLGKSRVDTNLQPRTSRASDQVTLTGNAVTVETDESELIARHAAKSPSPDYNDEPDSVTLPLTVYTTAGWYGPKAGSSSLSRPTSTV